MSKFTGISMEKIMRIIVIVAIWSINFMIFNSCMPVDIEGPDSNKEDYPPMIVSTLPDSSKGFYEYSDLDNALGDTTQKVLTVEIIDLNDSDILTLNWGFKSVGKIGANSSVTTIKNIDSDDDSMHTLEFKIDKLVCDPNVNNLNRVSLLVSDQSGKEDFTEWIIRRDDCQ